MYATKNPINNDKQILMYVLYFVKFTIDDII